MKILKSLNKVMKLLKPPPKLTLSEWSDIYRMLTSESSAEAGRWQTSRAPYQKEIMDAVSNPEVEKVVVMSSSQVGKTEIILNIIGYYIDYMPCPMMLVMPIEEMLKSFSKDRLAPMISATPTLAIVLCDFSYFLYRSISFLFEPLLSFNRRLIYLVRHVRLAHLLVLSA